MYNAYFGFSRSPFENNPDPSFLFLSRDHKEVLSALVYFIKERKGFALVCGDVGTGKTTLINASLENLSHSVEPILLANPRHVGYERILLHIAQQFDIPRTSRTLLTLVEDVKSVLLEVNRSGRACVLIIDEAHLLSDRSLEEIRLLSNIETPDQKLLQILLVGQYELSDKLHRPEMRQLRQRININRFLSPLDFDETPHYVKHRLQVAGSSFEACFEPECKRLIYVLTGGVPRQINQLCDNALLICTAEGLPKVTPKVLRKAHETLRSDTMFRPQSPPGSPGSRLPPVANRLTFTLCGIFILVIVLYMVYANQFAKHLPKTSTHQAASLEAPLPAASHPIPQQNVKEEKASSPRKPIPLPPPSEHTVIGKKEPGGSMPSEAPPGKNPQSVATESTKHPDRPSTESPGEKSKDSTGASQSIAASESKQSSSLNPAAPPQKAIGTISREPVKQHPAERNAPRYKVSRQIVVKQGDTLTTLAARWYPADVEAGIEAILMANPQIANRNRIWAGQVLALPGLSEHSGPN